MDKIFAIRHLFDKSSRTFARFRSGMKPEKQKIVVITGCDSGLGYSLSRKCSEWGFPVVSGCLDLTSEGARSLSSTNHAVELDVRSWGSVKELVRKVNTIIEENDYELYAVVNNAGIMVFGEFEWLTENQIHQQVNINMMGSFRVAKEFLPLLRKYKGRLINITSHCSLANLPSLSVYGATKAAIQSWSDGVRVEQAKYGVKVLTFIPGSLAMQSNIMRNQREYASEMLQEFTPEQKAFYKDYFELFNSYLINLTTGKKSLEIIEDKNLYKKFADCLMNPNPKTCYKHEPFRYFIYYNLFRFSPVSIRDYFVKRFTKYPSLKCDN